MPRPALTVDEYERTVASLRGARLTAVTYVTPSPREEDDGYGDWDFGWWHRPTMGVEPVTDDDTP